MEKTLLELEKVAQKYNESVLDEATNEQLETFMQWARALQFPGEEYTQFVKMANGLDFNGLVVYSVKEDDSNNIYKANEVWHENKNLVKYLMFSDSDIAWYCFDLDEKTFCELDKPSGTLMNTFDSFSEMITYALEQII